MAEGSSARSILGGLGGPKARPNGVADGQTVDIPSPRPDDQVWCGDGAGRAERGAGDAASKRAGPAPSGAVPRRKRAQGPPWVSRSALAPEKSPHQDAGRARTADRHWWPGINVPRGTGDPSSRNSAIWPRNFGTRGALAGAPAVRWEAGGGRREPAQATVYQKHSSLLRRKPTYRG